MRDPSPDAASRLAAGAGDFASGVASLMRAFSAVAGATGTTSRGSSSRGSSSRGGSAPRPEPTPDQSWSAATRSTAEPMPEPPVDRAGDPWGAATRDDTTESRRAAAEAARAAAETAAAAVQAAAEAAAVAAAARRAAAAERAEAARRAAEEPARPGKPVTRPTDVWAAAVANAANDYSPAESAVAGSSGVDHDVAAQGTPAPADDRVDRPGSDAPGDAE